MKSQPTENENPVLAGIFVLEELDTPEKEDVTYDNMVRCILSAQWRVGNGEEPFPAATHAIEDHFDEDGLLAQREPGPQPDELGKHVAATLHHGARQERVREPDGYTLTGEHFDDRGEMPGLFESKAEAAEYLRVDVKEWNKDLDGDEPLKVEDQEITPVWIGNPLSSPQREPREEPTLFRFGGGGVADSWAFGYWTGPEKDLLCTKPEIATNEEAERYLSSTRAMPLEAVRSFMLAQEDFSQREPRELTPEAVAGIESALGEVLSEGPEPGCLCEYLQDVPHPDRRTPNPACPVHPAQRELGEEDDDVFPIMAHWHLCPKCGEDSAQQEPGEVVAWKVEYLDTDKGWTYYGVRDDLVKEQLNEGTLRFGWQTFSLQEGTLRLTPLGEISTQRERDSEAMEKIIKLLEYSVRPGNKNETGLRSVMGNAIDQLHAILGGDDE